VLHGLERGDPIEDRGIWCARVRGWQLELRPDQLDGPQAESEKAEQQETTGT